MRSKNSQQHTESSPADLLKTIKNQQHIIQQQRKELEDVYQLLQEKAEEIKLLQQYKSEFLANMSHEFRTPLNSIQVFSQILSENTSGNLTPEQIDFVQSIHTAGCQLLALINDVLDFSALETGAIVIHPEEINIRRLATWIEQTFLPMADQKGLLLSVTLADTLPSHICTDRQRVERIISHLLSNALKFTGEGEIRIHIACQEEEIMPFPEIFAPPQTIAISIADTGIGIPEKKLSTIFDAFHQVDGTTARPYEGIGLGLSIARALAELLEAEICVESTIGKGSNFTLYLPERLLEKKTEVKESSSVDAIRDDRRNLDPKDRSILIIDADPASAKYIFDHAHERGFKCLLASDGEAGLVLAQQYDPTVILLSLDLPGLDGSTVITRLKKDLVTRHIPAIVLSSRQKSLDAQRRGAIGYQEKPNEENDIRRLFERIEQFLTPIHRKLLLVSDDENTRQKLGDLLSSQCVKIDFAATSDKALTSLKTDVFDMMVLAVHPHDFPLESVGEYLSCHETYRDMPVIFYSEHDAQGVTSIMPYTDQLVLKSVMMPEQLLEEVSLFLHLAITDLRHDQQEILRRFHADNETLLQGKTVLMIDTDIRNVFALSHILEERGIDVRIAQNGQETENILATDSETIDLVLMDTDLPDKTGESIIKDIRHQRQFKELPIIVISKKARPGDRQHWINSSANEYLSKPIDTEKLLSLLRVWLY